MSKLAEKVKKFEEQMKIKAGETKEEAKPPEIKKEQTKMPIRPPKEVIKKRGKGLAQFYHIWEGKNSYVALESYYPAYVFNAPKFYCFYLKGEVLGRDVDRPLFTWDEQISREKEYLEFKYGSKQWEKNPAVMNLIREDLEEFENYYYEKEKELYGKKAEEYIKKKEEEYSIEMEELSRQMKEKEKHGGMEK